MVQQELGFSHPFTCENGGALYLPEGYFGFEVLHTRPSAGYQVVEYGRPYAEVVDAASPGGQSVGHRGGGFQRHVGGGCGNGLPVVAAQRKTGQASRLRRTILDSGRRRRCSRPSVEGPARCASRLHRGGRFDHAGAPVNKGMAVGLVTALYGRAGRRGVTVGLGDSWNDVSLLRQVDVPVVVHHGDSGAAAADARTRPDGKGDAPAWTIRLVRGNPRNRGRRPARAIDGSGLCAAADQVKPWPDRAARRCGQPPSATRSCRHRGRHPQLQQRQRTIGHVVQAVEVGLAKYFPTARA